MNQKNLRYMNDFSRRREQSNWHYFAIANAS